MAYQTALQWSRSCGSCGNFRQWQNRRLRGKKEQKELEGLPLCDSARMAHEEKQQAAQLSMLKED